MLTRLLNFQKKNYRIAGNDPLTDERAGDALGYVLGVAEQERFCDTSLI